MKFNKQENDFMTEMNTNYFNEALADAIAKMEYFIAEAKRDAARPDDQMTPTQKVSMLHRHFANALNNATMVLDNASGYATALVVLKTKACAAKE